MPELPDLGSGPIDVILRTAIVYLAVVVGLRFAGKGEVGQLSILDLVALLLLSNAVQNAMVGEDSSIIGGLLAAATILVLARGLTFLAFRFRRVEKALIGEPRILIRNGMPMERALKEEEITDTELAQALREHGLEGPEDVDLAVLEVNGDITILPSKGAAERFEGGPEKPRRAARLGRRGREQHNDAGATTKASPKEKTK
jgi:uncharacterized membrane protein YcaP (DUF421 family)